MQKTITQIGLFSTISALAIFFSSCGTSKVAECKSILTIVDRANEAGKDFSLEGKALAKEGKTQDTSKSIPLFTTLIIAMNSTGKDMKALELKDEKLKGIKNRFVILYQGMSNGLEKSSGDLQKKDVTIATKKNHLSELNKVSVTEKPLINELNTYCEAK